MSEQFLAGAIVVVKADTTEFRSQLLKAARDAEKKPVSVKITADITGFERDLRTKVQAVAEKVVAKVLVRPDMTGFVGKLQTEVAAAAKRVTARVAVTPIAGAAAPAARGVGGGGGGASRALNAEQELAKAQAAAAFARKRITGDLTIEEKRTASLAREKAALAAAEKAVTKAIAEQNAVALTNAEALRKSAAAAVAKREGTIAKAEEQAAAPARRAAEIEATEKARVAAAAAAEKEMTALHVQALRDNAAFDKAAAAERIRVNKAADQIIAKTRTQVSRAEAIPPRIMGNLQAQALKDEAKLVKVRDQASLASRQLGIAEEFVATTTNRLAGAREALSSAEVAVSRARRAFDTALKSSNVALKESTLQTYADARALEVQRIAAVKSAEAQVAASKKMSFRLRGFGAQIATFAGLRGAVLAANAQFIAGTVAAIAFGKAVKSAANLESELNVFRVTAGATAQEMQKVSAQAEALGRDVTLPAVSAGDAAQAMTELAKAGLTVQDSIAGARGVLQLATAAQIDNAQATQLAASALNAFGLAGSEAVHVADVLTNAANASQGSIEDMGIALQQSAAVARQVGISFEDTVAFLTLLARNGIKGSDAGTSLRVAFTRLINPTDKAQKVLSDLNVQLRDVQGNIRPEVFTDFARAQADLTKKQQDANAAIVFGTDALRAYSIISREGVTGFNSVATALDRQGSAAELANARMAGLQGAAENAKNQLEALGLTIGDLAKGPLTGLAEGFASGVGMINTFVSALVSVVETTKAAFDKLNDLATIDVFGLKISPSTIKDLTNPFKSGATAVKFFQNQIQDSGFEVEIARAKVSNLVTELNKIGGLTNINKTVVDLQKLQKELSTGDERSQKFAADLGIFITKLQQVSANPKIDPFKLSIEIPPDLLSGEPGRIAGRASKKAFLEELTFGPGDQFGLNALIKRTTEEGIAGFAAAGAAAKAAFLKETATTGAEASRQTVKVTQLQRVAVDIQIAGGPEENQRALRNLKKQEQAQRALVKTRTERLAAALEINAPKDVIKKRRDELDEAKNDLLSILNDEESITNAIASEAEKTASEREKKAKEIQDARDKADQAVLDSFTGRQNRIDLASIRAAQTETLKDDLAVQVAIATAASQEIGIIEKTVKNQQTRRDEIAARVKILVQAGAEIDRLRAQIAEAVKDAARKARDLVTETLGKRLQLAQLKGGKDEILAAFAKAIADAKNRVRNAKKLGLVLLDEQIALQQLINDRNDFLKQASEDAKKGTTAFDLLKQASETFLATGGNLIGGNQPFAGPTGFTADIAQWLRSKQGGAVDVTVPSQRDQQVARDRAFNELIDALRDNTAALTGNRTAGVGGGTTTFVGALPSLSVRQRRFFEARQTREALEAENG